MDPLISPSYGLVDVRESELGYHIICTAGLLHTLNGVVQGIVHFIWGLLRVFPKLSI